MAAAYQQPADQIGARAFQPVPPAAPKRHGVARKHAEGAFQAAPYHQAPDRKVLGSEKRREVLSKIISLGAKLNKLQSDIEKGLGEVHLANKLQRQRRALEENEASLNIQRVFRGHIGRRATHVKRKARLAQWAWERSDEQLRWNAACAIQRAWRSWGARNILYRYKADMQRKREKGLTMIQAAGRSIISQWKAMRKKNWFAELAATNIQRVFRGSRDRRKVKSKRHEKEIALQLRREHAAVRIQCAFKSAKAREHLQKEREGFYEYLANRKRHFAAEVIQRNYKCHREASKYRRTRRARLEAEEQALRARTLFAKLEKARIDACCTIQRWYRSLTARREAKRRRRQRSLERQEYMERSLREHSAETLQAFYRVVKAKATVNEKKNIRKELNSLEEQRKMILAQIDAEELHLRKRCAAATSIQSAWRGHASNKKLLDRKLAQIQEWEATLLELQSAAAVVVQRNWRGCMGRRRAAELLVIREEELALKKEMERIEMERRALEIEEQRRLNEAACIVQQFCLAKAYNTIAAKLQRNYFTALLLQVFARSFLCKKILFERLGRKRNKSALTIQCEWRKHLARAEVRHRKSLKASRIILTTCARAFLSRAVVGAKRFNRSVKIVQAACRSIYEQKIAQQLWADFYNARCIQSFARAQASSRLVAGKRMEEWSKKQEEALAVQLAWKQYQQRKEEERKKKQKAITTVQSYMRCITSQYIHNFLKYNRFVNHARVIQMFIREALAKEEVQRHRARLVCARVVQRACIAHIRQKRDAQNAYQRRRFVAARKIQQAIRNSLARRQVAEKRDDRIAQLQDQITTERQHAAYVLCSFCRNMKARKLAAELRRQRLDGYNTIVREEAALVIQLAYRQAAAREVLQHNHDEYYVTRVENNKKEERHVAAMTIQKNWRRYLAKKEKARRRQEEIMAFEDIRRNEAAMTLQRNLRILARRRKIERENREEKERLRQTATNRNTAAIKIQKVWRGALARMRVQGTRAIHDAQLQEECRHTAALMIQTRWRIHVAQLLRKDLEWWVGEGRHAVKCHEAAAAVQRAWRLRQARARVDQLRALRDDELENAYYEEDRVHSLREGL